MAAWRCSGVRVPVETDAGAGVTLVTTFEAGGGAGTAISRLAGGVAAGPGCCFKYKAVPRTSNPGSNSAKTYFGLMSFFRTASP
jgi:hypothetical protein